MYLMKKNLINRRCKGLAVVEAAIVFPLLILLTVGIIEYGWLFLKAHQLANAARIGARVAIRADSTIGEVTTAVNTVMADARITGFSLSVSPGVSVAPGSPIEVKMTVPSSNVALVNTPLLPMPATLGASVTMAKEGP